MRFVYFNMTCFIITDLSHEKSYVKTSLNLKKIPRITDTQHLIISKVNSNLKTL